MHAIKPPGHLTKTSSLKCFYRMLYELRANIAKEIYLINNDQSYKVLIFLNTGNKILYRYVHVYTSSITSNLVTDLCPQSIYCWCSLKQNSFTSGACGKVKGVPDFNLGC